MQNYVVTENENGLLFTGLDNNFEFSIVRNIFELPSKGLMSDSLKFQTICVNIRLYLFVK